MSDLTHGRTLASMLATRRGGLREEEFARSDPHVRHALSANKRNGLLLAVRGRWIALAVIAVMVPFMVPWREAVFFEVALLGFALIGWLQLRIGRVAYSRVELLLILGDLALMAAVMLLANPLRQEFWPDAFQFRLSVFDYFYVLLAAGTLAYSWRTLFAFGLWTGALWFGGLVLVILFGREVPELTARAAEAFADHERVRLFSDPNNPQISRRIQEVVVFLIVVGILAANSRRNNQAIYQQAETARERTNLARHFPPNIVEEMAERDQPLGEVRSHEVAVMFVDIVGFTALAEGQSPERVVGFLRDFHGRLERAVFDHQGTLDKFLGDGLMATFGTPEPGPRDAVNALACARAMLSAIESWNRERLAAGEAEVRIAIGLHYGPVVLGDIGSERRLEFAVLGDCVNVASRLEALTREHGVALMASGEFHAAVGRQIRDGEASMLESLRPLGAQHLRGRSAAVEVWAA